MTRCMDTTTTRCEVCEQVGPSDRHPCRFEIACRCWWGEPCKPQATRTVSPFVARALAAELPAKVLR